MMAVISFCLRWPPTGDLLPAGGLAPVGGPPPPTTTGACTSTPRSGNWVTIYGCRLLKTPKALHTIPPRCFARKKVENPSNFGESVEMSPGNAERLFGESP